MVIDNHNSKLIYKMKYVTTDSCKKVDDISEVLFEQIHIETRCWP